MDHIKGENPHPVAIELGRWFRGGPNNNNPKWVNFKKNAQFVTKSEKTPAGHLAGFDARFASGLGPALQHSSGTNDDSSVFPNSILKTVQILKPSARTGYHLGNWSILHSFRCSPEGSLINQALRSADTHAADVVAISVPAQITDPMDMPGPRAIRDVQLQGVPHARTQSSSRR